MRFNLYLTHWSLLIITLISSCFLFYVVASENAKYVTTTKQTIDDATLAASSVAHKPSPTLTSSKITTATTTTSAAAKSAAAAAASNSDNNIDATNGADDKIKTDKILPNYKKIKKLIPQQNEGPPPAAPAAAPTIAEATHKLSTTEESASSSHLVNSPESKKTSDELIKSSDNIEIKKIENNQNLYNNFVADIKNDDDIHSFSSEESSQQIVNNQVPDVEQPTGNLQQEQHTHIENDGDNNNNNADKEINLPDITDIPTVTVTELPLETLQQPQISVDPVIIDGGSDRSQEERVNRTVDIIVESEEEIQKDEQIIKINDPGGGSTVPDSTPSTIVEDPDVPATTTNNIPTDASNLNDTHPATINASLEQQNASSSSGTATPGSQVNLTAEEVPMPVFSEWAQKQMEEAEKQQALKEQEQTFNNSAQRKNNNTNGNGKPPALKIRAKNYASPDCGAKIIASSAYTSNAGAVLSSSKDEYMLSLCGNRIWFVVELCEAIQAQKIDFANFELYSSSPQNFTVAVSKRFPTREWSSVGRFEAEDKRAVQSFDLHPQLFGKFVRVDINSHYSKEHFCTLSLFRVFGTSEFEAFETENHPNDDLDDFDDDYLQEQNNVKNSESNLFKSASDAVLSIVKKATEVLGKPANNQNQTFKTAPQSVVCRTPIYGLFSCAECSSSLVERVNNALTCEFTQLNSLLNIADIRNDLLNTRVCGKRYGIDTPTPNLTIEKDIRRSFYINILPNEYVGALCQLLAMPTKTTLDKQNNSFVDDSSAEHEPAAELPPSNLTREDKKFDQEDLNLLDHPEKKLIKPEMPSLNIEPPTEEPTLKNSAEIIETSTEASVDDTQQLPRPLEPEDIIEMTTPSTPKPIQPKPNLPDTNIFNVPAVPELATDTEQPVVITETTNSAESFEQPTLAPTITATLPTPTATPSPPPPPSTPSPSPTPSMEIVTPPSQQLPPKSEEDSNSWDNIEHLLTSTVPSSTVGTATGGTGSAQYNQQQQQKGSNGPQSESVFIRLSNRIKALERNMSLSGQYLEELSRRYKKQVEELQQTLTQQIQTVRTLEEQNLRHHELEQLYALRNSQLKDELDDLTLQVHACIVVIIFVGAFVFLVLMVGILFYRSMRRETKEVLNLYDRGDKKKTTAVAVVANMQKKIDRRKSFEDFSDRQPSMTKRHGQDTQNIGGGEKFRRPSEEVMLILKESKAETRLVQQPTKIEEQLEDDANNPNTRQRKMSVFYGSNNNINSNGGLPPINIQKSLGKRKGEKHSWPNTAHAQQQAWQHLEQLNSDDIIGDSPEVSTNKNKKPPNFNGQQGAVGKSRKKKESQSFKRQQSSPAEASCPLNSSAPADLKNTDFDERLMLDEDDLDNFIPNTDLAYNEFMPDGPRGYQCINSNPNAANNPASKSNKFSSSSSSSSNKNVDVSNVKKSSRRLSSPVFFKSPFTKSLKGKISSKSNPAHESTSWEWYRLKKSASSTSASGGGQQQQQQAMVATTTPNSTNNAFLRVSPNTSLDSSSLSEINFPTNSTENSFRILEEAILSSGESAITTTTSTASPNANKSLSNLGGISSSSNSNRSTSSNSSTQSKKKNRSFNKIFRKVF